jgi:hypothetical protein
LNKSIVKILILILIVAVNSCISHETPLKNPKWIDPVTYWIDNFIAPKSIFYTASEYIDISSGNSVYVYSHPNSTNNYTALVTDKYIPFQKIMERTSKVISDGSLKVQNQNIYFFSQNGASSILKYEISQLGPFDLHLFCQDIDIDNFGSYKFVDIDNRNVSASRTITNINLKESEILEIVGKGTRTYQRRDSSIIEISYQILEIYLKDIGLYYYAECSRYPINEGIKYKRKVDIEELKKILKDSNMTFFGNSDL